MKTVIEVYRHLYPGEKLSLAAPTGKASRRMAETTGVTDAQTLHSLLGLYGDDDERRARQQEPLDTDFLIVDETSMMDMWLAHQLFKRLRLGTKVLLVGDADQLESVGAGDVFIQLINCGIVPVTVLDEISARQRTVGLPTTPNSSMRRKQPFTMVKISPLPRRKVRRRLRSGFVSSIGSRRI